MRRSTITALALLTIAAPLAAQPAHSVADFSGTQGLNGWFYGYWDRTTDGNATYAASEFAPMPTFGGGTWFVAPGTFWTDLYAIGGHPNGVGTSGGRTPDEQWAIRRYVPTLSGWYDISGTFGKLNLNPGGDGTTALVLVGGTQIFSQTVGPTVPPAPYAIATTYVVAGTPIDFIITPGPNASDLADDSQLTADLAFTATPEPGTLALAAGGLVALVGLRRRRGG